jgi:hypothetical protein
MEDISKNNALDLLSNWERQHLPIFVMCATPLFALSAKNGRLTMCLDECIDLSLADGTQLRLSPAEAAFSRILPGDFPAESLPVFPPFEQGVGISFPDRNIGCYLLACTALALHAEL